MSKAHRQSIPVATKRRLWGAAAGRCELCSRPLTEVGAFRIPGNLGNDAHICAYGDGGPRADSSLSLEQRNDFDNLMLLCPGCHKMVDANQNEFPAELLAKWKAERESAIAQFVESLAVESAYALTLAAPIHGNPTEVTRAEWSRAMLEDGLTFKGDRDYPLLDSRSVAGDMSLCNALMEERLRRLMSTWEADSPIAVFAIGPQPLLMSLGSFLGDKRDIRVFQKQRETASWCWQEGSSVAAFEHDEVVPGNAEEAAVVLSVSGSVNRSTLPGEISGSGVPVLELRACSPSVNIVRNKATLGAFADEATKMLDEIHSSMPRVRRLHVFPALPTSLAVRFGSLFNPNLLTEAVVYEKQVGMFAPCLTIGGQR